MPRPRAEANSSRARKVAAINTATPPAGVFSHPATAPSLTLPRLRGREWVGATLSAAEIFLIWGIVLDQHAAVYGQRYAGDHPRRVTGEKQDRGGNVLGFAHAAQRDPHPGGRFHGSSAAPSSRRR